jgi:hypothetical protein
MKAIRLFDWQDSALHKPLREVRIKRVDDYTRGGKARLYVWSDGAEFDYVLYPEAGTAYPEYDNRVQQQRVAERYRYQAVEG